MCKCLARAVRNVVAVHLLGGPHTSPCGRSSSAAAAPLPHRPAAFLQCSTAAAVTRTAQRSAGPAKGELQQVAWVTAESCPTDLGLRHLNPQHLQQQQQQQQPPWPPAPPLWQLPCAAASRTALCIAIGSLLVGRYTAARLAASSTGFATLPVSCTPTQRPRLVRSAVSMAMLLRHHDGSRGNQVIKVANHILPKNTPFKCVLLRCQHCMVPDSLHCTCLLMSGWLWSPRAYMTLIPHLMLARR